MANSVNKAIIVGRLGRDPETRYTSGGKAVANFTVATDESFKNNDGERQKRTEWHNVVVWGKLAEIVQQYLKKGYLVYVEGKIQSRTYEDKRDGSKKYITEIVINEFSGNVQNLEPRRDGNGGNGRAQQASEPEEASGAVTDEDIPF